MTLILQKEKPAFSFFCFVLASLEAGVPLQLVVIDKTYNSVLVLGWASIILYLKKYTFLSFTYYSLLPRGPKVSSQETSLTWGLSVSV